MRPEDADRIEVCSIDVVEADRIELLEFLPRWTDEDRGFLLDMKFREFRNWWPSPSELELEVKETLRELKEVADIVSAELDTPLSWEWIDDFLAWSGVPGGLLNFLILFLMFGISVIFGVMMRSFSISGVFDWADSKRAIESRIFDCLTFNGLTNRLIKILWNSTHKSKFRLDRLSKFWLENRIFDLRIKKDFDS